MKIDYQLHVTQITYIVEIKYRSLGCWKDLKDNPAIPSLEGNSSELGGSYRAREKPIMQCAKAAASYGYDTFAIKDSGKCSSAQNATHSYSMYGESSDCNSDGEGDQRYNEVYKITTGKLIFRFL